MGWMDLRQINYFLALYDEGSVTRAAQRLHVVQPAVSMQIARLERELDQKLFERTPRLMVPTAAARTLHRLLLPVVRNLNHAREQMARLSGVVSGRLTLGMLASIANSVGAEMLADFTRTYPEVEVALVDGYSSTFIEQVSDGKLDFAIINRPGRKIGLIVEPMVDEHMVLAARSLEDESPLPIAQLADLPLVLPTRRHGLRTEFERHLAAHGVTVEPKLEIDSIEGICAFVAQSHWVTVLPSLALRGHVAAGRLRTRPILPAVQRRLAVIHHPHHPLSPAALAFIDHLRTALGRSDNQAL
jgi:DNA-binding transcriptional LysR family regulator